MHEAHRREIDFHLPAFNDPAEVREMAEALGRVNFDVLLDQHRASLDERYHGHFDDGYEEHTREGFDIMRRLYGEAAGRGEAVVSIRY